MSDENFYRIEDRLNLLSDIAVRVCAAQEQYVSVVCVFGHGCIGRLGFVEIVAVRELSPWRENNDFCPHLLMYL